MLKEMLTMEKHEDTKSNAKCHECEHCEKKFKLIGILTRHLTKVHGFESDKSDFVCDKCSKIFTSKKNLAQHIKQTHENLRLHECDSCEKTFKRKPHLVDHKALKHEPWKFKCETCSKEFALEK